MGHEKAGKAMRDQHGVVANPGHGLFQGRKPFFTNRIIPVALMYALERGIVRFP